MSRVLFKTGQAHQENTVAWARQRLADASGRRFASKSDQDGVLLADGVGLGKTWEAVGAAALLLYKKVAPRKGRRHVLILTPANLITKWEAELAAGSMLHARLLAWTKRLQHNGQAAVARCVLDTLTHVLPIRSTKHVQTRKMWGRFVAPGGTYLVSQSLISRQGRGLAALRRQEWDVVIVDEAHTAVARKALETVQGRRRCPTKLLLSATPFQLEPRQFNDLARNLLVRHQRVLTRPAVARYVSRIAAMFDSGDPGKGPSHAEVQEAGRWLRKLAARSLPRSSNRTYEVLLPGGVQRPLETRLDQCGPDDLERLMVECRFFATQDEAFEEAYFTERARLALQTDRTFVATRLRRLLSSGTHDLPSPRQEALRSWAVEALKEDMLRALDTGCPHKIVVFTSWVGSRTDGEAAQLHRLLAGAYDEALSDVADQFGAHWNRWVREGSERLRRRGQGRHGALLAGAFERLAQDPFTAALAGKKWSAVASELRQRLEVKAKAFMETKVALEATEDYHSFEARSLRRRLFDEKLALSPWTGGRPLTPVERYTGDERRTERDRAATAFCELGPPWVLVASNVGSEGIDLHRHTARIVHFDLEWNPARMEQREGRGDRVGRRLKDKLRIVFCVVPRTYDERMLHQLVARDRWHGVLLGKPASKLEQEHADAPLLQPSHLDKVRLRLAPGRQFSR